jgi:hypothetical protein
MAGNFRFGSRSSVLAWAKDRHAGLRRKPLSLLSSSLVLSWTAGLCFLLIVITAPVAVVNSQVPYNGGLPGVEHSSSGFPGLPENANPHPDRNRILEDAMHLQLDQKRLTMINVARQKEMTTDTAKLVALATEVKAETDKSGKDALSAIELHKVEQIEKLAHTVREKMSASVVN